MKQTKNETNSTEFILCISGKSWMKFYFIDNLSTIIWYFLIIQKSIGDIFLLL